MALKGVNYLPPLVTMEKALKLFKKSGEIRSQIARLDATLEHSLANEQLLQLFSLQDSVQSTRIEGTQITFTEMVEQVENETQSDAYLEVQNYQRALSYGLEQINKQNPLTSRLIKELHKIMMGGEAGEFRRIQNFIGPTNKIEDASYIPVSPEQVDDYMTNLEFFMNDEFHRTFEKENISADKVMLDYQTDSLIKTAIIHAQFESIHPFLDGNGRMGRILIVLYMIHSGSINYPVLLVSEELEKERARYYNRLNAVRGNEPDWYQWIDFFLDASERTVANISNKLNAIEHLNTSGYEIIISDFGDKDPRSAINIWQVPIMHPVVTAKRVADILDITMATARKYLNKLSELGLIEKDNSTVRNIKYYNYDVIRIFAS